MNMVLLLIFIGSLQVTSYRSVKEQTDKSPFFTSIGKRTSEYGIAVSQDLLKDKRLAYLDWVYIEGIGLKQVTDCMNKRYTNRIDIWVGSLKEERAFHKRHKNVKLKVYKIGGPPCVQKVGLEHYLKLFGRTLKEVFTGF